MTKGYILFGDARLMDMFWEAYGAVQRHIHRGPWYLPVDMFSGQVSSLGHCSLGAFWPGMQVLLGDIDEAVETTRAHYSVWRRYGCVPESYNVHTQQPVQGAVNYPLRPEVLESVFYLHWATNDSSWIGVALSMMHSLETLTRVECGFARIRHVGTHAQEDLQGTLAGKKPSRSCDPLWSEQLLTLVLMLRSLFRRSRLVPAERDAQVLVPHV
jgi:Glycosyl hydrolase family 47